MKQAAKSTTSGSIRDSDDSPCRNDSSSTVDDSQLLETIDCKLWANSRRSDNPRNSDEDLALKQFYLEDFNDSNQAVLDESGQIKFLDTWVSSLLAMDEVPRKKKDALMATAYELTGSECDRKKKRTSSATTQDDSSGNRSMVKASGSSSPVNDKINGILLETTKAKQQKSPRSPALDVKVDKLDLSSLTRGIRLHSIKPKTSSAVTVNHSADRFIDFFHDLNDKF